MNSKGIDITELVREILSSLQFVPGTTGASAQTAAVSWREADLDGIRAYCPELPEVGLEAHVGFRLKIGVENEAKADICQ